MRLPIPLVLPLLLAPLALLISAQGEPKPTWHQDWPTAQRLAKQTNKPVFAVFVCQH
jgi:hypothetical protein